MSDAPPVTDPAPKDTPPAVASAEPTWAKPAIALMYGGIFIILILVSWVTNDKTSFAILSGVGAALVQQSAAYYLGSSAGSARKTELAGKP